MKKRTAILALALAVGISEAAAAQRAGLPGRGPAYRLAPETVLRLRDRLELTDDQVARLEEMAERSSTETREAALAARTQRAQLQEALGAESVDLNQVRTHFDSAQALQSRLQWLRIESGVQVAQLLTDEQRTLLRQRAGLRGRGIDRGGRLGPRDQRFRRSRARRW